MGETGEPCGIPVVMGVMGSDSASKVRLASLSVRNESTHLMIAGLRRICLMVCRRRLLNTLSNAPLTSMHRVDLVFPSLFPWSMMDVRSMTASTADLLGLPPIWRWCNRWCFSARWAKREAMIFSEIFPRQLRREIGR